MKKHFQTPQEMIEEECGIRVPNGKAAGADDFVAEFSVQGQNLVGIVYRAICVKSARIPWSFRRRLAARRLGMTDGWFQCGRNRTTSTPLAWNHVKRGV